MPSARKFAASIALISAIFASYLLMKRSDPPVHNQRIESSNQSAAQEAISDAKNPIAHMNSSGKTSDPTMHPRNEDASCISLTDFESDPVLSAEYARFDSLVTSGPTIESYRGLSSAALTGLAGQGDSAAMAVLGAMSVMRVMNLPDDAAVAYLLLEGPELQAFDLANPLETEIAEHLEEARAWFYKAAIHGRLLALQNVGEVVAILGGSPAELGWIQQEDYDSLETFEKHALDPANVYAALAFEVAPELRSGPMGTMISEQTPGGERQQMVLHELAWRFGQEREATGLPPIEISESTGPSMEEFESMLCEP